MREPGPVGPPDNNNDSGKGDDRVRLSVEPGVGPGPGVPPDTLAHALHSIIYHWRLI